MMLSKIPLRPSLSYVWRRLLGASSILALCASASIVTSAPTVHALGELHVLLPKPTHALKSSNAKTVAMWRYRGNKSNKEDMPPPMIAAIQYSASLGWHAVFRDLGPGLYDLPGLYWQGEVLAFDYAPKESRTIEAFNCDVAGRAPDPLARSWWQRLVSPQDPCKYTHQVHFAKVSAHQITTATGYVPPASAHKKP